MLVLDEFQQLTRFGVFDQLERVAVLERREELVRHVVGLTGAERTLQDLLGVLDAAFVDIFQRDRALIRLLDDRIALFYRNGRDLCDLQNDAFYLILPQKLEDRRRKLEPERDQPVIELEAAGGRRLRRSGTDFDDGTFGQLHLHGTPLEGAARPASQQRCR